MNLHFAGVCGVGEDLGTALSRRALGTGEAERVVMGSPGWGGPAEGDACSRLLVLGGPCPSSPWPPVWVGGGGQGLCSLVLLACLPLAATDLIKRMCVHFLMAFFF